jgi:hypothetical protein
LFLITLDIYLVNSSNLSDYAYEDDTAYAGPAIANKDNYSEKLRASVIHGNPDVFHEKEAEGGCIGGPYLRI